MQDITCRETFLVPAHAMGSLSLEDASTWNKHNVFAAFLSLNHERLTTLYFRIYEKALIALEKTKAATIGASSSNSEEPIDTDSKLRQIRSNIFFSADRIYETVDKLRRRDLLRFTPSFGQVAAAIYWRFPFSATDKG